MCGVGEKTFRGKHRGVEVTVLRVYIDTVVECGTSTRVCARTVETRGRCEKEKMKRDEMKYRTESWHKKISVPALAESTV
jgi:hypothetical protein